MIGFLINSVLLGVGLAMDAFSVSIANGLNEPEMRRRRQCLIAGTYAFFQCVMPLAGWFCVHMLLQAFQAFEPFIPWIALGLLAWIGGKMLRDGIRGDDAGEADSAKRSDTAGDAGDLWKNDGIVESGSAGKADCAGEDQGRFALQAADSADTGGPMRRLGMGTLLLQGVATSIDALSVGFAIAGYRWGAAILCALIIAAVTFAICMGGLGIGRRFGTRLGSRASILGGCILIFIGLEIFVRGVLL